jgi:predicted DNA-binding protein YlxM (UPF0122 family)
MNEIWKEIPSWEGIYMVSNFGRVKRTAPSPGAKVGRILTNNTVRSGYKMVRLRYQNRIEYVQVHRLVLSAFSGNCPSGKEANHKNGNPSDNRLENLEWVTRSENLYHSYNQLNRTVTKGEKFPQSKLTENHVIKIRSLSAEGTSYQELAKLFNVSKSAIAQVVKNRSWKHV